MNEKAKEEGREKRGVGDAGNPLLNIRAYWMIYEHEYVYECLFTYVCV